MGCQNLDALGRPGPGGGVEGGVAVVVLQVRVRAESQEELESFGLREKARESKRKQEKARPRRKET